MKKVVYTLLIASLFGLGVYVLYRAVMPKIIAEAVISDSLPGYIPKRLQTRVEAIKTPINKGAEAMLETMHRSDIPLEKVLETIDGITEKQAYSFLDEVNKTQPATTNDVFDLAKKHFPAEFDPEVFREPFNQHFTMKQIRNGLAYANMNRRSNDVDITTAKAILKKIIMEKDKEVSGR